MTKNDSLFDLLMSREASWKVENVLTIDASRLGAMVRLAKDSTKPISHGLPLLCNKMITGLQ